MREIDKRLIVSDFDGTLINDKHQVSPEVRSAIDEYVSCGGVFVVCTGRMLSSILPRVRELGLRGLVAAYQGTVIADIESGEIIKKDVIKFGDVACVCQFLEGLGQKSNTYSDEVLYTDLCENNEYLRRYENIIGIKAECIKGRMSDFVLKHNLNCQKITCLVSPHDRDKLYAGLLREFGDSLDVTCSANVLVEISPLNDTKGAALKYIAEYYKIPVSSTVAIGDNLNDMSMIKTAEIGVAVGNSVEQLKKVADFVTVTNNEGAVAKVIQKYGFKQV